jgi:arginine utilization protein RocB
MSNETKQTAVEWLLDRIEDVDLTEKLWENVKQQAKEMEKEQAQNYAEFCVMCDRENLPLLDFESYILTYGGNK